MKNIFLITILLCLSGCSFFEQAYDDIINAWEEDDVTEIDGRTPFQKADIDENGMLNKYEFEEFICQPDSGFPCVRLPENLGISFYDVDKDLSISEMEFNRSKAFLECLDENSDKKISKKELFKKLFKCK